MIVEDITFDFVDLPRWAMRITIIGQGFEQRAVPIVALVGEQAVEGIMPLFEENGVMGFLANEPNVGDAVQVGFADSPLNLTDHTYNPPVG